MLTDLVEMNKRTNERKKTILMRMKTTAATQMLSGNIR